MHYRDMLSLFSEKRLISPPAFGEGLRRFSLKIWELVGGRRIHIMEQPQEKPVESLVS